MSNSIQLIGLATNDPVPGNYVAVNFAQGAASNGATNYSAILIGNKTSDGYATVDTVVYGPDTPVQLASEADAIYLFGVGSELHRMYRAFVKVNKVTSLYAIAVTESAGSKATGNVAITNAATAAGTLRVFVGTDFVDTSIASGDSVNTIATNVAANINANVNLPVTATAGSGLVTLTAKQKGLRGNWIRYSAQVIGSCATTASPPPTAAATLASGTTADSNATALTTIANTRFYYQVSAAEDATQLGALLTQINSNAAPTVGIRCRAVAGSVDTLANVTTVATGLNAARAEIVWSQNSDLTPAELAANGAAVYSLFETGLGAQSSLNFNGFGADANTAPYWFVPAPRSGTAPTRAQIKSALLNGITPIASNRPGVSYLVRRITTRSLNGTQPDYRTTDTCKVTVCDRFADDLVNKASLQFAGKVIGNDPATGQRVPGRNVVTPRVFLAMVNALIDEYGNNDLLQNVSDIKAAVEVVREASPTTRISCRVPLQVVDILNQSATNVDQTA